MVNALRSAQAALGFAVVWKILTYFLLQQPVVPRPHYGGTVHPAFRAVRDAFIQSLVSGRERGAAFAVYHQGEPLVDLWGGHADPDSHRLWSANTISQAWSATKGVAAVVVAIMVDRGLVTYEDPVAKYWPEFGCAGKENITVAMLLSHQAGLTSLGRRLTLSEYRDNWTMVEELLALQKPLWTPGHMYSYHAFTWGMYVDALVRKVDIQHRNLSVFFRDEVAVPLGLDFHVGLPLSECHRCTRSSFASLLAILVNKFLLTPASWRWIPEVFFRPHVQNALSVFDFMEDMRMLNSPDLQSVGLPSALGFGTARSLAQLYDYLANNGSVHGRRLLSQTQISALATPLTEHIPVIAAPDRPFSAGLLVNKNMRGETIIGHRGHGGQDGFADLANGLGVAYLTSFHGNQADCDDPRAEDLFRALYRCVENYQKLGGFS